MQLPSSEMFIAFDVNEHDFINILKELRSKERIAAANAYLKLCRTLLLSKKSFGEYLHDMIAYSEQPLVEE